MAAAKLGSAHSPELSWAVSAAASQPPRVSWVEACKRAKPWSKAASEPGGAGRESPPSFAPSLPG